MKTSAGCLVRASFQDGVRYLLVHPSGNYNRRAPWSIPKGLLEPGESPEDCAARETREETGIECRIVGALGETVLQKSRKRILGFLAEAVAPPEDPRLEPGIPGSGPGRVPERGRGAVEDPPRPGGLHRPRRGARNSPSVGGATSRRGTHTGRDSPPETGANRPL